MSAKRLNWPSGFNLARSDDNRLIACIGRNVVVIDMEMRARVSTSHPISHPCDLSFSPNGDLVAVKSTSGRIVTIDPFTGATVTDFGNQKEGEGCGVHFSPDGDALIDGSWRGVLTIRRVSDGEALFYDSYEGETLSRLSHDKQRRSWLVQHQPKIPPSENLPRPSYVSIHHWPFRGETAQAFSYEKLMKASQMSNDGTRFAFASILDNKIYVSRCSDGMILCESKTIEKIYLVKNISWSNSDEIICLASGDEFIFLNSINLSFSTFIQMKYARSALWMEGDGEIILGSSDKSAAITSAALLAK